MNFRDYNLPEENQSRRNCRGPDQKRHYWVDIAVVAGSAILGAGATVYGADKQASASAAANEANKTAVQQANDQNWTDYLLQRGITTGEVVPAGTLPQSNAYQAVNTKLPLW